MESDRYMARRQSGWANRPYPNSLSRPHHVNRRRPNSTMACCAHLANTRPQRDWIQISANWLPGLAAAIALVFTWQSVSTTNHQLYVTEQGQITDRYNAAIANLASPSIDVRLGGIYALQRIMQDSSRDQPTVIAVLCAFVRDRAALAAVRPVHAVSNQPSADVQAALTVVITRDIAHDGTDTVVNLSKTNLTNANLYSANLNSANLSSSNLSGAELDDANLSGADLTGSDLHGVNLRRAEIANASLDKADLSDALVLNADLRRADVEGVNFSNALLDDVNLSFAILNSATLDNASLDGSNLSNALLEGIEAKNANFDHADLRRADFTTADLADATLVGADLTGANLGRS
jgi:uncharacterized protein YjbI with pentapeptide repeats